MTTNALAQPNRTAGKLRVRSRIWVVVAKELEDLFLRSQLGLILLIVSCLVVPIGVAKESVSGWGARDPWFYDVVMREFFPIFLGGAAALPPMGLGMGMFMKENLARTLEPLFVAGVRRWEIVIGKLVAFEIIFLVFTAIQIALLAVLDIVPAFRSWRPFLNYYHPNAAFFIGLGLAMLTTGSMTYLFTAACVTSSRRTGFLLWLTILPGALTWQIPELWLAPATAPVMNTLHVINGAFYNLPNDPRLVTKFRETPKAWMHPHFVEYAIAASIIGAMALLWVLLRNLRTGLPVAYQAGH